MHTHLTATLVVSLSILVNGCSSSDPVLANKSQRLIETTETSVAGTINRTSYEYDENGYITKKIGSTDDVINYIGIYETNDLGQITRLGHDYDADGIEDQASIYAIDGVLGHTKIYQVYPGGLIGTMNVVVHSNFFVEQSQIIVFIA